jgi:hypothetical protein
MHIYSLSETNTIGYIIPTYNKTISATISTNAFFISNLLLVKELFGVRYVTHQPIDEAVSYREYP